MLRTFRARYPGIRVELGEVRLNVDRSRVVDSTTDEFNAFDDEAVKSMGVIKIRFTGQQGYDAGGLTDDWLSLYMAEAMDMYRRPPLFLPPLQMEGETSCLRINHSLRVMGVSEERQRQLFRTFGIVLGICMKRGRFACNKCATASHLYRIFVTLSPRYMLSKSLLQRLLGQELPDGIIRFEPGDMRMVSCALMSYSAWRRSFPTTTIFLHVCRTCAVGHPLSSKKPQTSHTNSECPTSSWLSLSAAGDIEAFDEYLELGDKKYVVSSKIADFETIRRNLAWTVAQTRR
jgi:hypothetical protein